MSLPWWPRAVVEASDPQRRAAACSRKVFLLLQPFLSSKTRLDTLQPARRSATTTLVAIHTPAAAQACSSPARHKCFFWQQLRRPRSRNNKEDNNKMTDRPHYCAPAATAAAAATPAGGRTGASGNLFVFSSAPAPPNAAGPRRWTLLATWLAPVFVNAGRSTRRGERDDCNHERSAASTAAARHYLLRMARPTGLGAAADRDWNCTPLLVPSCSTGVSLGSAPSPLTAACGSVTPPRM